MAAAGGGESVGNRVKLSSLSSNERSRRTCARRSLAVEYDKTLGSRKEERGKDLLVHRLAYHINECGCCCDVANVSLMRCKRMKEVNG